MVGNTFAAVFMIENTVLVKEIEKYSSCNTLVSVTEAMIFGDEIKKIGRFFFKGRVNILTAETLVDIGLSGNIWLVSFKISYLCLPLFYETRTTPSCHPSGCAYRQL